jgi:hypothetical protein
MRNENKKTEILDSLINGQVKQAKEQFKKLRKEDRKKFVYDLLTREEIGSVNRQAGEFFFNEL